MKYTAMLAFAGFIFLMTGCTYMTCPKGKGNSNSEIGRYQLEVTSSPGFVHQYKIDTVTGDAWAYSAGVWSKM